MTPHDAGQAEQLSALADGQLHGNEFAQALRWLADSEEARCSWHTYHLVGDVLRSADLARGGGQDVDFVLRLRERLQAQGDRPGAVLAVDPSAMMAHGLSHGEGESANAPYWRWTAGLATLALLAGIGWQLIADLGAEPSRPSLAQVGTPAGSEATPHMLRDPRLDQWLAAHQQFGGTSALQMPAGFLRNATYEQPTR